MSKLLLRSGIKNLISGVKQIIKDKKIILKTKINKKNKNQNIKMNKKHAVKKEKMFKPVAVPAAISKTFQQSPLPKFNRIKRTELVYGNVSGTGNGAFGVRVNVPINPGQSETFPWLSIQAQCYSKYKFHSLKMYYVARCPTNVAGSVEMAFVLDATQAPPNTEIIMSNFPGYSDTPCWKNCTSVLDTKVAFSGGPKLVRCFNIGASTQLDNYDCATFFLATNDAANSQQMGKLFVEYDCEFFEPVIPSGGSLVSMEVQGNTSITATIPFGQVPNNIQNSGANITWINNTNTNVLTIANVGNYILVFYGLGTGFTVGNTSAASYIGTAAYGPQDVNYTTPIYQCGATTTFCTIYNISTTSPNAQVALTATNAASITSAYAYLYQVGTIAASV
jgi:hypothetical protein